MIEMKDDQVAAVIIGEGRCAGTHHNIGHCPAHDAIGGASLP